MKIVPSRNLPQLETCGFLWRFRRLGGVTLPPMRSGRNKGIFWHDFKKESRTDFQNLPLIFCCELKYRGCNPDTLTADGKADCVFTSLMAFQPKGL